MVASGVSVLLLTVRTTADNITAPVTRVVITASEKTGCEVLIHQACRISYSAILSKPLIGRFSDSLEGTACPLFFCLLARHLGV